MADRARLRVSDSAERAEVVHLDRGVARRITGFIHPLDRVQELRSTGWDGWSVVRSLTIEA